MRNVLTTDKMVDAGTGNLISDLKRLIRVPSISTKNLRLQECATLVNDIMQRAGINSSICYLDSNNKTSPPVVYGEVRSRCNPFGKTVLFYNHYDVQPVVIRAWSVDPFGGHVCGNKIFGRGASDNKGELVARIKAVEWMLKSKGDVPCNIKFFVEGEEEIGSPNIERYIRILRNKIEADAIIWEFGYIDTKGRPIISLGVKGMLYVELVTYGPSIPLHSGLAVLVRNPAWNLIKALNTMWDEKRNLISIKDWYKEITGFTKEELDFISRQPTFDIYEFKKRYKIIRLLNDIKGNNIKKALAGMPTCNISGLHSGNGPNEIKTIIPSVAKAKIDFRLVPQMDPRKQYERLKEHLRQYGLGDISARYVHGVAASRTSYTDPFVRIVRNSVEKIFRAKSIVNLSADGTGPMNIFVKTLKRPCIAVGCTPIFANIHSYNEYARIDLLNKGAKCIISIIENMSLGY